MKVGLLTSWMSNRGGGVFDAVHRLAPSLQADADVRVAAFGLADRRMPTVETGWGGATASALPTRGPDAWGYAPGLRPALGAARLDLLHVHGLWMYYTYASLRWAHATGRPHMISPHGMLDPWAVRNSAWKKQLVRWAYEDRHLRGAACLHALCEAEATAIRAFGLNNPICIIPNGLDQPEARFEGERGWQGRFPAAARVLLYLGRLHPKKGLVNLLRAWAGFDRRAGSNGGEWYLAVAAGISSAMRRNSAGWPRSWGSASPSPFSGPCSGPRRAAASLAPPPSSCPRSAKGCRWSSSRRGRTGFRS
jgi:poly(glycerol-phosphate) alpha-glucosyltransferase